jgi:hypothetical protein
VLIPLFPFGSAGWWGWRKYLQINSTMLAGSAVHGGLLVAYFIPLLHFCSSHKKQFQFFSLLLKLLSAQLLARKRCLGCLTATK